MGKKLAPGTHTRVPLSPGGDAYQADTTDSGTQHKVEGTTYWFAWDESQGLYRTRIPPPPSDPPGEWVFLEFTEGEGFDVYTATPQSQIWTEQGKDYEHG